MFPYFALVGATAFIAGLNRATILSIHRARERLGKVRRSTTWTLLDVITVVGLVAFSGLRWQVGTDYASYARLFERMHPTHWAEQLRESPQEVGYTLLALFLRQFTANPELLFWVTSLLTVVPAYMALKKSSRDMTMSLVLYILIAFYVTPFNIIRQGIAISLNFWASTFIDKNKKAFFIINAIAATFHVTALFAAVIQFVFRNRRVNFLWLIVIIFGAILAAALLPYLGFVHSFLNIFNDRYDMYLVGAVAGVGTYLVIFGRLGLGLYGAALGKSDKYARYTLYIIISAAFVIIGTQAPVVSRMQHYFSIFLLLLLPNQLVDRSDQAIHKACIYAFCLLYFWLHLTNWGGLLPYQTAP